jgi:hypothetical protein
MTDLSPVYTKCRTPSMNSPARRIHDHGLQCLRLDSKLTPFCFTHLVTPINPLKLASSCRIPDDRKAVL